MTAQAPTRDKAAGRHARRSTPRISPETSPQKWPRTTATSLLNTVRCRRGLAIFRAKRDQIWPVSAHEYRVPSQSGPGIYSVSLEPGAEHCSCPDYKYHAHHNRRVAGSFFCKHLYAALLCHVKDEVRRARIPQSGIPGELEKAS